MSDRPQWFEELTEMLKAHMPEGYGGVILVAPSGPSGELKKVHCASNLKPETARLLLKAALDQIPTNRN